MTDVKIMRLPEVMAATGMSRSMIYMLCKAEKFPKQVKLNKRASGWVAGEVEAWLEQRIAQCRKSTNG